MSSPIVVNFNVSIDASGSISVFGQEPPTIINKIVATKSLPVTALYDETGSSNSGVLNSVFEFWEGSDSSDIQGTLSSKTVSGNNSDSQGRDYTKLLPKFVFDLQAVLDAPFDCSSATPFNNYTSTSQYYTPDNFGRLALSSYAHYLFGHVAATAAITNDVSFMNAMLSKTNPDINSTTATYPFSSDSSITLDDISGATASATNANLALRLVKEIMTLDDSGVTNIVKQVIGQDASRAKDQDNNDLQPGVRQALKFIAGDKIYMNIHLQQPNIVINGNGNAPNGAEVTVSETNYTLEITLDEESPNIVNEIPSIQWNTLGNPNANFSPIIESGVLKGFNGVRTGNIPSSILLSNINISSIEQNAFKYELFNTVMYLDLAYNQLSTLPNGIFYGLTSLIMLNTESNINLDPNGTYINKQAIIDAYGQRVFNAPPS